MGRMTQGCVMLLLLGMTGCEWCGWCRHCDRSEEPCLACFRTPMGPRPGEDQYARAGYPREVAHYAHPSDTGAYVLYPVGGGQPCRRKGREPGPDEGVWGWDYCGRKIPSNVELLWTDGKFQGGFEGYRTYGPNLAKKVHERHEHHEEGHENGHEGGGHEGGHNGGAAHNGAAASGAAAGGAGHE